MKDYIFLISLTLLNLILFWPKKMRAESEKIENIFNINDLDNLYNFDNLDNIADTPHLYSYKGNLTNSALLTDKPFRKEDLIVRITL